VPWEIFETICGYRGQEEKGGGDVGAGKGKTEWSCHHCEVGLDNQLGTKRKPNPTLKRKGDTQVPSGFRETEETQRGG